MVIVVVVRRVELNKDADRSCCMCALMDISQLMLSEAVTTKFVFSKKNLFFPSKQEF